MRKKEELKIEARASTKNIRASAIKMRRITDRIRGCSYEEALVLLEFLPHQACYLVSQLVLSAAANASTGFGLKKSDSFICEARVENSTYLKRFRPRAQGRGYPIRKPTCKIIIGLNSQIVKNDKKVGWVEGQSKKTT
uniref:Large ribosomal subunit protein uL22c n=1 Tax=Lindsaea linearis TaxID=641179 RepID=A0A5B9RLN3_9MONI|nr:ribosomal protein L22 [Lindsaea linearis]QEG57387.1 ribosomal protein L22 [Lindsaea linearis]